MHSARLWSRCGCLTDVTTGTTAVTVAPSAVGYMYFSSLAFHSRVVTLDHYHMCAKRLTSQGQTLLIAIGDHEMFLYSE